MDFSIVDHKVGNYVIYYIDCSPICDADGVAITSPILAAHAPITLTSIYPNATFDKATKVIIRLTSDKFNNGNVSSRVIYIFTAVLSPRDTTTDADAGYVLSNPTSMLLCEDVNVTSVDVFAVVNGVEIPVDDYHIQLCSAEQPKSHKSISKKILTKIKRKI